MALKVLYITQYSIFSWIKTRKVIQANEMQLFAVFTTECKGQKVCTVCSAEKVVDCAWLGYRAGLCKTKCGYFIWTFLMWLEPIDFLWIAWTIGYGSFLIRLNVVVYFLKMKMWNKALLALLLANGAFYSRKKEAFLVRGGGEGMKTNFPSTISPDIQSATGNRRGRSVSSRVAVKPSLFGLAQWVDDELRLWPAS